MTTRRKIPFRPDERVAKALRELGVEKVEPVYTEVKRVVGGEVRQTTCCCADPGGSREGCRKASGNKTPCRCACHRTRP